jgi:hypothetical protein
MSWIASFLTAGELTIAPEVSLDMEGLARELLRPKGHNLTRKASMSPQWCSVDRARPSPVFWYSDLSVAPWPGGLESACMQGIIQSAGTWERVRHGSHRLWGFRAYSRAVQLISIELPFHAAAVI